MTAAAGLRFLNVVLARYRVDTAGIELDHEMAVGFERHPHGFFGYIESKISYWQIPNIFISVAFYTWME